MSDAQSLYLGLIMFAIVAIVVFEVVKRETAEARSLCICGHRKFYTMSPKGHVRPMDYDCKLYIDGAEFDPWKCRECRCRKFIPK